VYNSVDELKPHRGGLGISILSTPQGVMSDSDARAKNVDEPIGWTLCGIGKQSPVEPQLSDLTTSPPLTTR